jgi:hypothetical protein
MFKVILPCFVVNQQIIKEYKKILPQFLIEHMVPETSQKIGVFWVK